MKKLDYYVHIFCSSYTISTLLVVLVNILDGSSLYDLIWNFQMAIVCGVITILMFITDIVYQKLFGNMPVWIFVLLGLFEVVLSVFLLGGLCFEWFTLNWFWIAAVIGICIIIYFAVFGIMLVHEKKSADSINKVLRNSRIKNQENRGNNSGENN